MKLQTVKPPLISWTPRSLYNIECICNHFTSKNKAAFCGTTRVSGLAVHGQISTDLQKGARIPQNQMLVDKRKKRYHLWKYTYQLDIFIHFHNLFLPTSQKLLNIFKMYWTLMHLFDKKMSGKSALLFSHIKFDEGKQCLHESFKKASYYFHESVQMGQPPFLMVEMEVPSNNKVPPKQ